MFTAPIVFDIPTADDADGGTVAADPRSISDGEGDRLIEIASHEAVQRVNVLRDHEGVLLVEPVTEDIEIYPLMYVSRSGRIAKADVNQPTYFATFAELVA